MSEFLSSFCKLRPFVYHLTSSTNLDSIRDSRRLYSAKHLLEESGEGHQLGTRRKESWSLEFSSRVVHIRDQKPLHEGNLILEDGMSFEALIACLNSKVFFWPGTLKGPISYGERHFQRYRDEQPAILRTPTADLIQANLDLDPLLCRFNSGSPRWSGGKPSPRGLNTFEASELFDGRPSDVVEFVFEGKVALPESTLMRIGPDSSFEPLFG